MIGRTIACVTAARIFRVAAHVIFHTRRHGATHHICCEETKSWRRWAVVGKLRALYSDYANANFNF